MITEPDGTFITARQFPRWYGLLLHLCMMACISPHQMAVAHMFVLLISPHKTHQPKFGAHILPREFTVINKWLSRFSPAKCNYAGVGQQMTRRVKRHNTVPLSFADGYPYLLANEASLRDLRRRCPASVKMEQFRPQSGGFRRGPASGRR